MASALASVGLLPSQVWSPAGTSLESLQVISTTRGGYLGVRLNGAWDRTTVFGPSYAKGESRPLYTLGFSPRFGWTFGVSDDSYIALSAGLEFYRTKMSSNEGGDLWRTPITEDVIPVTLEMIYGIRF